MLLYIFIFVYLVVLSSIYMYYEEKKDEIKFLTIPTFILFLVFDGFRKSSVGGDLSFYVGVFKEHSLRIPELSNIFNSRFEIGYILFNNLLRSITDSYTILLFSFAIITLFIWFYVFWNYSQNIYISLMIYFSSLGMLLYSFSNIRQGLSISIGLLGFHYFVKEKYIKGVLCIFIASLFHITGIICILFLLVRKIHLSLKFFIVVILGLILTFPLLKKFSEAFVSIFPQYTSYLESSWFLESYKLAPVILSIVYVIFFVIGEIILKNSELTESEEYIRILYFCYLIFTITTMQTSLLSRFAHYFSPFVALYVPMFIQKVPDRRIKWALLYLIIIVYSIFLFVIVYYKADWYNVVPYRSVIVDWLVGKEI